MPETTETINIMFHDRLIPVEVTYDPEFINFEPFMSEVVEKALKELSKRYGAIPIHKQWHARFFKDHANVWFERAGATEMYIEIPYSEIKAPRMYFVIPATKAIKLLFYLAHTFGGEVVFYKQTIGYFSYDKTIAIEVESYENISFKEGAKIELPIKEIHKGDWRSLEKIHISLNGGKRVEFVFKKRSVKVEFEWSAPLNIKNIPVHRNDGYIYLTDSKGPIDELADMKFSEFNECSIVDFSTGIISASGETIEAAFEAPLRIKGEIKVPIKSDQIDEVSRALKLFGVNHVDLHPAGIIKDKLATTLHMLAVMKDYSQADIYLAGGECYYKLEEELKKEEKLKKAKEQAKEFEEKVLPRLKEELEQLEHLTKTTHGLVVDSHLEHAKKSLKRIEEILHHIKLGIFWERELEKLKDEAEYMENEIKAGIREAKRSIRGKEQPNHERMREELGLVPKMEAEALEKFTSVKMAIMHAFNKAMKELTGEYPIVEEEKVREGKRYQEIIYHLKDGRTGKVVINVGVIYDATKKPVVGITITAPECNVVRRGAADPKDYEKVGEWVYEKIKEVWQKCYGHKAEEPTKEKVEKTPQPMEQPTKEPTPEEEGLTFIITKLTNAYEAEMALQGFKAKAPEDFIRDLAMKVFKGEMKQVEAMVKVLSRAKKDAAEMKLRKAIGREEKPSKDKIKKELIRDVKKKLEEEGYTNIDAAIKEASIDIDALVEQVATGEIEYPNALKSALTLVRLWAIPPKPKVETKAPTKKVVFAPEIWERPKEEVPTYVYEYVSRVPEWLKDALKDPKVIAFILTNGVKAWLAEMREKHPDADNYTDFVSKWVSENIIYKAVQALKKKMEIEPTWADALALYILDNYGGKLVLGGYREAYRGWSWIKAWLIENSKRGDPYSRTVLKMLGYKVCMTNDPYTGRTLKVDYARKCEKGQTSFTTPEMLIILAIAKALDVLGYEHSALPWPFNVAYETFRSALVRKFAK